MLQEKYRKVLTLGEKLDISDGYVNEEAGKLKIGGTAKYAYDKDQLWDAIKEHADWESEVEADIKVANTDVYGVYTVKSGDTLWAISKKYYGQGNRYQEIFKANTDTLKDPDKISVGQVLKIPTK